MSLSAKHIDKIFVALDPRINQHQNNEYIIKKGGAEYNFQLINANNISPNSCTFNFNTPGIENFIDRCIWNKVVVDYHIIGVNTTPGTNICNIGVSDAPAYMPLRHRLYDTVALGLNSDSLTIYSSDVMPVLARTNYSDKQRRYNQSISCAQMMDKAQNFSDSSDPACPYFSQLSLSNNPLGPYGQGGDCEGSDGRGAYKFISRTKISDNEEIIRYEFTEPLPVSPCIDTDYFYEKAFYGINTITLNMTFNASAINNGSMWSHNDLLGNVLTSVTSTIVSSQLLLQIINPPTTYIPYRGTLAYKYDRFDRYITPIGVIPAGSTVTGFQSNSITISIFPSKFLIVARRNPNSLNWKSTETYGLLRNLQLTLKSRNGILATFTPEMLYELSVENGVKLTYNEWSRDIGSVVSIPIEYCKLADDEAAAVQEQIQIQVRTDVTNLNYKDAIDFQLLIIPCNPGVFLVDAKTQKVDSEVGLVTKEDVINSNLAPVIDFNLARDLYGADLIGDIKSFGHKLGIFAQQAAPYVKKGLELGAKYGPQVAKAAITYGPELASLIGLGEGDDDYMGDGRRRRKSRKPLKRRY